VSQSVPALGGDAAPAKAAVRWSAPPLVRFLVRRLLAGALTLVIASAVVFVATSVVPGSPAAAVLGKNAQPTVVAKMDHKLGYDKPVLERYVTWLAGAIHGDFGNSAVATLQGEPDPRVWPIIRGRFGNTITLALVTIACLVPLSLLLGVFAGVKAGSWADSVISVVTLVLMSLPEFVVGALLVAVFFVGLGLLPGVSLLAPGQSPLLHPQVLVLPVLTLLSVSVAWTVRLVRVGVIEVLKMDYVHMARLHGIREARVRRRYVLRNALAPSVQIFALSFQYLFGGVIVTEAIFNYPGLGSQIVNAVVSHDNTEVQAIAMILATIYILINITADLLVMILVPKLRLER
jgi:peptide/nickel transport system permease protein